MKRFLFLLITCTASLHAFGKGPASGRSPAVERMVAEEEATEQQLDSMPANEQLPKVNEKENRIYAKGVDVLDPHSEASCSTTEDLRKSLGPNRNQSGTNWCYAFTAADMLTQKLGTRVSAAAIASLYYQQKENLSGRKGALSWSELTGGYVIDSLRDAERAGNICTEEEFHSDQLEGEFRRQHPPKKTSDYTTLLNQEASAKLSVILKKLDSYEQNHKDPSQSCDIISSMQLIFPELDVPTVFAVLRKAADSQEVVFWLKKMSCKHPLSIPKILPKPVEEVTEAGHGRKLLASIDEQLEHGQLVGLTLSLPALLTADAREEMKSQTVHSSSIVQRKFFNGQCQYLIRDSLGKNCEGYHNCDSDPGNYWVSASDLDKAALSIQYFP